MNYEQLYKEALERARKHYEETPNNVYKAMLESLFPELAESKDERIRKRLLTNFSALGKEEWGGLEIKDILSWLEKQGQKPFDYRNATISIIEENTSWSEEDEKMVGNIRSIVEKYAISQSAVDVNGELCDKTYIDADNWLKSIKNRII